MYNFSGSAKPHFEASEDFAPGPSLLRADMFHFARNVTPFQTGKYVVRSEDLPRASKLSCAQRPIKRIEFEKYAMPYGEEMRGRFF